MLQNKRILIIIGIILVLLVGVLLFTFGCKKQDSGQKVTLNFWGVKDDKKIMDPLIDTFQKENPNITVNYIKKDSSDLKSYEEAFTNAISNKEAPDIFMIKNDWLPKQYKKLASLPEDVLSSADFKKDFLESAQKELTINNKIYSIPQTVDALALFYNTDMFYKSEIDEPPATWQQFITDATKLTQRSGAQIFQSGAAIGGSANVNYSADILSMLMLQNKTTMLSEDKKQVYFNRFEQRGDNKNYYPGTSALSLYTSFVNPSKQGYCWNNSMENSLEAFMAGKTAMYFGYSSDISTIQKKAPKIKFKTAVVPQLKAGDEINYLSFWAPVVSKDGKNQEASWKFIKFLSEEENIDKYIAAKEDLAVSARIKMAKSKEGSSLVGPFAKSVKGGVNWYKVDVFKINDIFNKMITAVVSGQPAQASIDAAAKEVTKLLTNSEE